MAQKKAPGAAPMALVPASKNPLRSSQGENRARNQGSLIAKRARAANFIVDLANGMSQKAVAEKYNVSVLTVQRELKWADREGFFEKAEDAILHRLVPLAIDAYERALKKAIREEDFEAADRLLTKIARFFPANGVRSEPTQQAAGTTDDVEELSWERFTARRRIAQEDSQHESTASAPRLEGSRATGPSESLPALDAEIVREGSSEDGLHGDFAGAELGGDDGVA